MDIRITRTGQTMIAEVDGRIDGISATEFETAVGTVIPDAGQGLICAMTGVSYVSSAGLRVILMIVRRLSRQKSTCSICTVEDSGTTVLGAT